MPSRPAGHPGSRRHAHALLLAAAASAWLAAACPAQFIAEPKAENPVFVDESPGVTEALTRAREHLLAGNPEQAVRTLQKALDDHADGFVVSETDPNLFEPVRARVHAVLRASPQLLAKYREAMSAGAQQMLDSGRLEELERTRLLTPQGLTGALRLARQRVLSGQFDGAALTLLQIADHPDVAASAKSVTEIVELVGRYQVRPALRARLAALVPGTALPPADPAVMAGVAEYSLGTGSAANLVDDLVNQPLGTGVFGDDSLPIQPHTWDGDDDALNRLPRYAREMRYWPVVGERAVYYSDAKTVTALDRVSMRRLWSVDAAGELKLSPDDQNRTINGMRQTVQNTQEEVVQPVLAAGSSLLVSVIGRDIDANNGEGTEYLVGFDAQSGAIRYAVPLRGLDDQLVDSFARGPLVTDGRVVVVNMLKRQNQKRLLASVLVGVDALTGKRLWTRTVGSEGVLPFYRQSSMTDSTVSDAGVVYRYDRLGVIGAYAIADGRPLWVRRMGSRVVLEPGRALEQWLVHEPVVTPAGVVMMTPDRDELLVLDPSTGTITARRKTEDLRKPEYLLATPTHLVGVGELEVATVRLDQIETGAVKFSGRLGRPSSEKIRGRVTSAGSLLLIPSASGLTVINPEEPAAVLRKVGLDAPGSPLALPEGLLITDDARAHMYCTWAVAAAHLRAQIAAAPADPAPAVELLILAERAGKAEEILPAAESALGSLAKSAARPGDAAEQQRIADCRSSFVAALIRCVSRTIGQNVDQPGAKLELASIDAALAHATAAAQSDFDRVTVLLATGDVRESRADWSGAAATYQQMLADAKLSAANAPGTRSGTAAGTVATDRLGRVVKSGGRAAYADFDAQFTQSLAALGPNASTSDLEALATRYPVAQGVPALWLRVAGAFHSIGGAQAERARTRALERGVQAAERIGDADLAVVGELNGTLIRSLIDRSLLPAAADALARAQSRFPGTPLSVDGKPVGAAETQALIQRELSGARRWPRVGVPSGGRAPQIIEGWTLMEPLIRPTGGSSPPFVVLHKGDERRWQVAIFGLKQGQLVGEAAEGGAGELAERWYSESGSNPWTLVRTDSRGALFFVGEQNGGRLVRVDADAGKVTWQTEPFGSLFPTDPPHRFNGGGAAQRITIGGETRLMGEIVIATDDRTVCMVERAGRCAAVDADSGQVLWTARLPVTRIADATVSGGQLIAVGESPQPQPDNKLDRVALMDARVGTQLAVSAAPINGVRYMRTTSRGDLILGAGGTVVCIGAPDLETAKVAWTLTNHPAANAWEAWLLEDRLFLLGEDRALWEVSAGSGAAPAKSVDVQGRLDARTSIAVWQAGNGTVVFATGRGMALINGKGELHAIDAVNATEGTVLPAVTSGAALLLVPSGPRQVGAMLGDGAAPSTWQLHRLDTSSGQLLSTTPISFASTPMRMAAIDGRIVISTTTGTLVLDAPPEAK